MHPVFRIDTEHGLVALYWSEFPSMEELKQVVGEAIAHPQFKPGMNFLWDRKPGQPNSASVEYLREALYYLQMLAEKIGPHSWALVGHTPADFGKGRMMESLSDGTKVTIRAFKSAGDAEEWLRNPIRYETKVVDFPTRNSLSMHPLFA